MRLGCGYNAAMDFQLSAQRIALFRRQRYAGIAIEVVRETGSTNADLLARLPQLAAPVLLAAQTQTAGRGRAGRAWHSAPGSALTFSLAWGFDRPPQGLTGLPLAVGAALAETLARHGVPARLKWPNDVLLQGRKLGGVLIEAAASKGRAGPTWAVIGIGLNLAADEAVAARVGQPVADLSEAAADGNALLAAIADDLSDALQEFNTAGFAPFAARWNRLHAHAGQEVAILEQDKVLHEGRAMGVNENGQLLLHTAGKEMAVTSGDVSLRAVQA